MIKTILISAAVTITLYAGSGCSKKTTAAMGNGEPTVANTVEPTNFSISGNLKFTYSYCGGAMPSDEIIARLNTPRAVPNYYLYLKRGKGNSKGAVIDSAMCDTAGHYEFSVAKGDYTILTAEQCKSLDYTNFTSQYIQIGDKECFDNWWASGLYMVTVSSQSISMGDTILHQQCHGLGIVPCLNFSGPLPPMMRKQ